MHTVSKFNRGIISSTFKYNLAEFEKAKKSLLGVKIMSVVKISMKIKKYLICSTRALYLLCQVRACMPIYKMYVLHFNLSTYAH